jgi:phosphate transport system permease protein
VGASFFIPSLPKSLFDQFMALPYHLYVLSTQHHDIQTVRPIAYATALVLLLLIMTVSGGVILWRFRLRKKYQQW